MPRLVVVGDALLDVDLVGQAQRLCPDAPAPVVDVAEERVRPGGAGLAARLAARDGLDVLLVTALADDDDAARLRDSLAGVPTLAGRRSGATPVKTRVRGDGQSITRFDRGGSGFAEAEITADMLAAIRSADAVLVSDYGRGLTEHGRLRGALAATARHVPVVWDPHPRGGPPVPGAWLVTPNAAEAVAAADIEPEPGPPVLSAGPAAAALRADWGARAVAVTLGERGALLDLGGLPMLVPAPPVATIDPCGAGDQFAVAAAGALMRGAGLQESVTAAVAAASAFLADGGVEALHRPAARPPSRLAGTDLATAQSLIARTRARGGTVVATGGCFDLLHTGHLHTLRAARALGDCLIVCLNSDSSVRRLKGPDRPINNQADRAELLAALACVDAVVTFGQDTPAEVLSELRPDIWVKGGDYPAEELSELDTIRTWGGRAVVVPYHAGRSTTRLANALTEGAR